MSLFCGIFALDGTTEIPPEWREFLRQNLSRSGLGRVTEHTDRRFYLAKLDLGAFDDPGWQSDAAGVTALCGDAFLEARKPPSTRAVDVGRLHALRDGSADLGTALRSARGTFCAAVYRAHNGQLVLATDKVGVRPMYWMSDGRCLVFAGALRLLENLPDFPLAVDLRGALEIACFGFPLAERTQYIQIHSLRGGDLLVCDSTGGGRVRVAPYWRWDRDACSVIEDDVEPAMRRLYETFARAVQLRSGDHKAAFAALSGGLDSRGVVTLLRSANVDVHSINVSWRGSADQVLGAMYAKAIGAIHHETFLPESETGQQVVAAQAWRTMSDLGEQLASKGGNPRQLWAGDGGSVALGHVYIKPAAVRALREQGSRSGAQQYLEDNFFALTKRPFRAQYASFARRLPLESVAAELERLDCADPARALYVFLLENDQRRHLSNHFENLDRLPIEFIEPFFDAEVLAAVCRLPLDYCLRHRMYNQWLRCFPPQIMQVPWQYYPGHEKCPIPMPADLSTQWDQVNRALDRRRRRDALDGLRVALKNRSPLKQIMRVDVLAAAYVAMKLHATDAFWFSQQVGALARPLIHCNGRFEASI
jgi:asparagine synthase (glutamine-hydrolysing)